MEDFYQEVSGFFRCLAMAGRTAYCNRDCIKSGDSPFSVQVRVDPARVVTTPSHLISELLKRLHNSAQWRDN